MVSLNFSSSCDFFYRFITLIPRISIKSITPQHVPGNTTLSRLWLKRSLLMFASSEPPQKGLSSRCHHLQLCVNFLRFTTGCEFHTFTTLSCCNWRPCAISPSAGATLGQRPPSSRIQKACLGPLSSEDLPTASRLQAKVSNRSGSRWTLTSSFPATRSQHTRVACLP